MLNYFQKYMPLNLRKIIFALFFNSSLLLILFIGIQNNSNKDSVNFLINKSISLPIGFIVGTSFISGSITGSFLSLFYLSNRK